MHLRNFPLSSYIEKMYLLSPYLKQWAALKIKFLLLTVPLLINIPPQKWPDPYPLVVSTEWYLRDALNLNKQWYTIY